MKKTKDCSDKQIRKYKKRMLSPIKNQAMKVGRNELCPCKSGLKFKKCHGKNFK